MLVSDFELAWHHGITAPNDVAFIVKYVGEVRVRFFLRQHLRPLPSDVVLSWHQVRLFQRLWPGVHRGHVEALVRRMT
jgi:hypothetical protein